MGTTYQCKCGCVEFQEAALLANPQKTPEEAQATDTQASLIGERLFDGPGDCGLCGTSLNQKWAMLPLFEGHASAAVPYCVKCVQTRMTFDE